MNNIEFREIRDAFATDSMLKRLERLKIDSAGALARAKALRTKMKHAPKGQQRDLIEIKYDTAMSEWAYFECRIGDIQRDSRYIAHMAKLAKGQG